ncbi:molybdate ABC transporter substrate-binding protein [Nodosilinea sp. E11]|uniref:molybdate ABC transporter substrate-binding protein n=1 Tax=Nodosilinea sp. E11 TaxID=3037479 RepID=UPI002934B510|nr:molybdate ABC transporter substrate-binding protein [Nodosilinea sp. E11]WOD40105.1 molybdate ABC transporter substrate-binding protein [Nodosilinea sp. E11]
MKRRNFLLLAGTVGLSLAMVRALQALPDPSPSPSPVLVAAAASLQEALQAVATDFEAQHPTIDVTFTFGSSGALQQQIEQGAPVDLFISAGVAQMDALATKGLLVPDSRQTLIGNRLVLIAPAGSAPELKTFQDLSADAFKQIAVGEFRSVPAGQYAEQVLNYLGLLPTVQPKLVYANNVRAVLAAVEAGHAEAGLVYATDAALAPGVRLVATAAPEWHKPITYPIAQLQQATHPEAAQTFAHYLASEAAQAVFADFGFTVWE